MKTKIQDIRVKDLIQIEDGASYEGLVTEITNSGIWITEDDVTEEFIAYVDITEVELIYSLSRGN